MPRNAPVWIVTFSGVGHRLIDHGTGDVLVAVVGVADEAPGGGEHVVTDLDLADARDVALSADVAAVADDQARSSPLRSPPPR